MRVGFDVDGVLTRFDRAYQDLVIKTTGKDLFAPGDRENPPCWDWPEFRGYTKEEVGKVWDLIKTDPHFWMNLEETSDVDTMKLVIGDLERHHDVYFISSRPGIRAKRQTEIWLYSRLNYHFNVRNVWPTVLISSEKGTCAAGLKLDAYIDDNFDNVVDVMKTSPTTKTFLLDKSYNQSKQTLVPVHRLKKKDGIIAYWVIDEIPITRVVTLGQMLDHIGNPEVVKWNPLPATQA